MPSNKKKGDDYEDFVESVYTAILGAEHRDGRIHTVKIEKKKIITSASGTDAEIDLYWEYEVAGIIHKVAIECRNYKRNISIPGVRDFARKIQHISGLKGLMVSPLGFSDNAVKEANADDIDLLIIRELKPEDREGYLNSINITMVFQPPCRTIAIEPIVDKEWALDNGYKEGDSLQLNCLNNEIIIEDMDTHFCHSLFQIESEKFFNLSLSPGSHQWAKDFSNGWLVTPESRTKISSIVINYVIPDTFEQKLIVDLEKNILAIREFANKDLPEETVYKTGERVTN